MNRGKSGSENLHFLSMFLWNRDFISQENSILADVENIRKKRT